MYQFLIKRHLRKQFDRLSVGDYESVLRGVDDHVHHRFAGQHPLGGERHTKQELRLWFQRLFRLYRSLVFEVHRIARKPDRVPSRASGRITPVAIRHGNFDLGN